MLEVYEEGTPVRMGLFASVSAAAFVLAPRSSAGGQLLDVETDGAIHWKLVAANTIWSHRSWSTEAAAACFPWTVTCPCRWIFR